MLGIVGEAERLDSTVISDAVNLASRMEGLTKTHDADIIVTGAVVARLQQPDEFVVKDLGKVTVKGKREPIDVYAIVGASARQASAPSPGVQS